jgi:hypothetical protein
VVANARSGRSACIRSSAIAKYAKEAIAAKALNELVEESHEAVERVRALELLRLNKLRMALSPRMSDPRVADSLLRISEREGKLRGLDAPTRIEQSGPDGGPIQTEERDLDLSGFSLDELLIFEALHKKAHGDPNWGEGLRHKLAPHCGDGLAVMFARAVLADANAR